MIRAKIVLYAAQGLANDEIASRIDTARQIVSKWRKRFFEQGVAGFEELAGPVSFPPGIVVAVKALACELPSELGIPLSRFSMSEIKQAAIQRGLVASIGETTIWRWLSEDAIRPWHHRSWIFPRDPQFTLKAGRVLDLYERVWEGAPLAQNDFVICADEKTSVQARRRKHRSAAPQAGRPMRVEYEYVRKGAWAYLAAWDVQRARVFGRCEHKTGIAPFGRLIRQVMSQEPYRSADRVFWVVEQRNLPSRRAMSATTGPALP